VKYGASPELMFTLADRGIMIQTAGDSQTMTDEQRKTYFESILEKANSLALKLTDYIVEQDFEKYERIDGEKPRIIGGILVKQTI